VVIKQFKFAKWVRLVIFYIFEGHGTGKSREPAGWKTCATRFVPRYARGTEYEAARQCTPYPVLVPNRDTSFHRAGFSTFHLRGKTYGNLLVGSCWWVGRLSADFCKKRVWKLT
jgi:hypothetical protein